MVRTGPGPSAGSSMIGANVKLPEDRKVDMDGGEQYSDQEGGVEIVDMGDMESLDVMAPRGLPKIAEKKKKVKTKKRVVKKQDTSDEEDNGQSDPVSHVYRRHDRKRTLTALSSRPSTVKPEPNDDETPSNVNSPAPTPEKKGKGKGSVQPKPRRHLEGDVSSEEEDVGPVNMGQAVDASESEGEEVTPDIRGDFIGWDGKEVGSFSNVIERTRLLAQHDRC